jgi:phospholipid/cholesterol/gamma-HCH transport system substrate-binding protein
METRANYLVVGSFVLLLMVGALAFVLWLAKFQYEREFAHYNIFFRGNVTGLRVGSLVSYRGISVGEVRALRIDPANVEQVLVTVEIAAETPIKADTVASLEVAPLTGGATILLAGGTQAAADLPRRTTDPHPVIGSVPSRFEQVLAGAPELIGRANELVLRASALLSPENQSAIATTLANTQTFTDVLARRSGDIDQALADAAITLKALRDVAERTGAVLATIDRAGRGVESAISGTATEVSSLVADLRGSAAALTNMTREFEAMVAENRRPIRDFTSTALYEFSTFVNDLRTLINGLARVTTEVERDPARFIFGNRQQGYEPR